jgi:Lhr-like helicase
VSVSAPTSAGKSFLLAFEVIRRLAAKASTAIAYIVPTRALIRQVMLSIREQVKAGGIRRPLIRCVPQAVAPADAPDGIVYVLTQERLLSLLSPDIGQAWLDTLIVDEAQGIGDRGRGVLLHTAVEATLDRFPFLDVVFASPLAKNPEYLLNIFARTNGQRIQEQHSPVAQNLLLVESVEGDRYACRFSQLVGNRRLELGERVQTFQFTDSSALSRKAHFAQAVAGADGSCVIYSNGARAAEETAFALTDNLELLNPVDSDLSDFIQFAQEQVHESYSSSSKTLRMAVPPSSRTRSKEERISCKGSPR